MSMTQTSISRAPRPSSLADVLDLILDKGLVIDAYVRVSVIGIEVLTIDARVVVASVDTYLRFAEAVNRLDLTKTETAGLKELSQGFEEKGAESKVKGALEGGREAVEEWREGGKDGQERRQPARGGRDEREEGRRSRRSEEGSDGGGESEDGDEKKERSGLLSRMADRGKWSS